MKYIIALLILLSPVLTFAQDFSFSYSTIEAGTNLQNDSPIKAIEFSFPYDVYRYDLDPVKNELFILLRKVKGVNYKDEGYFALIDLNTNKVKWSRRTTWFDFVSTKGYYQVKTFEKIYCYNKENDSLIWTRNNDMAYLDPESYTYFRYSRVISIDPATGEERWKKKRQIDLVSGVEELMYLNDSILLVALQGIHTININDGSGWNYKLKTSKNNYGLMIASGLLGVVTGGAINGISSAAFTGPQVKTGMSSGMMLDGDSIYFASRNELVCLNTKGKKVWGVNYGEDATLGSPMLFNMGDNIVIMNRGFAYRDGNEVQADAPFIAAYNKITGAQVYQINFDNKERVRSFYLNNDTLFLCLKHSLATYTITTGSKIATIEKDQSEIANTVGQITPDDYYAQAADSNFYNLAQLYPYHFFIESDNDIYNITPDLTGKQLLKKSDLWKNTGAYGPYTYLQNSAADKSIVLYNNKKIANITLGADPLASNNSIFYSKDNQLVIVDVSGFK
ncbi:MAG: PQQ-binding-like beta-propeller repeat protein [Flavipsychrobacter sp.]|nr:PQQ-binding-like beta-propeller repeat protein [Flavipsychrobacter sp.]